MDLTAITKVQQAFWEAKRTIKYSFGNKDDECMISNDLCLDTRIQLLQAANSTFGNLISVLRRYSTALKNLKAAEEDIGSVLQEYGVKDSTKAGKVMTITGKAFCRMARKRVQLQCNVVKLLHDVQTFQNTATLDAVHTVVRMEQSRKSYRSGLMWMKNESQNLDPDQQSRMKKFRKVQDHIKRLQFKFNKAKLETMQKIDLYLFSRCNLFSQSLIPYQRVFTQMSSSAVGNTDSAARSILEDHGYKFETLKELNVYNKESHNTFKYSSTSTNKSLLPVQRKKSNQLQKDIKTFGLPNKVKKRETRSKYFKEINLNTTENCSNTSDLTSDLLINLSEDCNPRVQTNVSRRESEVKRYSDDLKTINLDLNQWEEDIFDCFIPESMKDANNSSNNCSNPFDEEITKDNSSGLIFWPLMETFRNQNRPQLVKDHKKSKQLNFYNEIIFSEFDPLNNENV